MNETDNRLVTNDNTVDQVGLSLEPSPFLRQNPSDKIIQANIDSEVEMKRHQLDLERQKAEEIERHQRLVEIER